MNTSKITNIGYITHTSQIGGAERMTEYLIKKLQGSDFVPHLACPSPGPLVELVRSYGVPVEIHELYQPGWSNPMQTYRHWQKWSSFIISNNLSLIIDTNGLYAARSAMLAAYTCHIPVLCHMKFPVKEDTWQWAFRRLPKPVGFMFPCHALREEVAPFLGRACPNARQWVVHNGIDIHMFSPSPTMNVIPRIGVVANLQPRKGHEDFLEMAALLTKEGKKAEYDIIGGDILQEPRQEKLQAYAKKLGIEERVTFHGQVDHVVDLVKQLDIVVCASYVEAFPVSILEAMACGKPIVATNIYGIPEEVEDSKTGILVPPHAPQALAEAVSKLLDAPNMRKSMGERSRERVEKLFSFEVYTAAILQIYREVLGI